MKLFIFIDFYFYLFMSIMAFGLLLVGFKYFLLLLIILEMVVMNITMFIFYIFSSSGLEMFLVYYLVFSVCESVLGLVVLVLMIRYHGDDFYLMMNLGNF